MCQYPLIRNRCIYKTYYFVTTASSICKLWNIYLARSQVIAPRAAVMCAAHLQLSLLIGLALVLAPGGGYAAGDGVEEDSIQEGGRAKEDSFVSRYVCYAAIIRTVHVQSLSPQGRGVRAGQGEDGAVQAAAGDGGLPGGAGAARTLPRHAAQVSRYGV